ncbi:hypothetical protein [Kosakonia arachidis]|uniref:hypothetical protein n=1 Tax=Kosakonia arachidis TaxID=551989 RepID=UPI0011138482|nr:hypothetical protein [Kosakonia arachidis]
MKLVDNADPATIQALPVKAKSIGGTLDDEHASRLATAISMALVKDPTNVLKATDVIENYPDDLQQRFGTSLICSIPGITHFTTEQAERYYVQAEASLVKAGEPASECLDNMRATMSEIRQEAESRSDD